MQLSKRLEAFKEKNPDIYFDISMYIGSSSHVITINLGIENAEGTGSDNTDTI
jgi:hypothetical protein